MLPEILRGRSRSGWRCEAGDKEGCESDCGQRSPARKRAGVPPIATSMPEQKRNGVARTLLLGATTGLITTVALQPLDVIKTQMQLLATHQASTGSAVSPPSSPRGVFRAIINNIINSEGGSHSVGRTALQEAQPPLRRVVPALWAGLTPSLIRTVPGIALYLTSVDYFRATLGIKNSTTDVKNLLLGAGCRASVAFLLLPFTVIKTRIESAQFSYTGVGDAIRTIYRTEGVKGLYKGGYSTLLRDVPFSALYLFWFNLFKDELCQIVELDKDGHLDTKYTFISGLCAGFAASVISQPFDVTKTMIQASTTQLTTRAALRSIFRHPALLMSGFSMRLLRRSVVASLNWTLFEKLHHYWAKRH